MNIEQSISLDYSDVLLKPKRSTLTSRKDVDLIRTFNFRNSKATWSGVPIMAANMDGVGTFSMAMELQKHKIITVICKHTNYIDWDEAISDGLDPNYVAVSTGSAKMWDTKAEDYLNMTMVLKRHPTIPFICVDVANGYHENFGQFISTVREEYPDKILIVGNVITREMTEELIIRGADIIKCGIGPGGNCTTRKVAGVGVPQLSGIIECADAANGIGGHIIADGGCTTSGDVAKAFGAGAHFVMLGGMLAAHTESEQRVEDGKVVFYGMSSDRAMETHGRIKNKYRASEGKVTSLPFRGSVDKTIHEILGGVRSACTYIGAKRIKDMPKCTTFVRVNNQINNNFNKYE
jgi:GMP reductase